MTKPFAVTYQGRVCRASCSYSRSVGLEPDRGFVLTTRLRAGTMKVVRFPGGTEILQGGGTVGQRAAPGQPALAVQAGDFLPGGFLELVSTVGEGAGAERQRVTAFAYVLPDALDVVSIDHNPRRKNHELRIQLTDVRSLYPDRGPVYLACNILRQHGAEPAGGAGGGTRQRASPAGAAAANLALPPERYEAGSLRQGRPWTLRQVLEEEILPRLPGRPRLGRLPAGYENRTPVNHLWSGAPAEIAVADLLAEFRLLTSPDVAGTISFWREGEGELALEGGGSLDAARVHRDEQTFRFPYRPSLVEVIGAPTVETVRVEDWGPVGRNRRGEWVPLLAALNDWGVATVELVGALLALPHADRAGSLLAERLSAEALDAIESWAFRAFRLPGSTTTRAHMVPIVEKAEIGDDGARLPPQFFSTRVYTAEVKDAFSNQADTLDAIQKDAQARGLLPLVSYTSQRGPIDGWRLAAPDIVVFDEPVAKLPVGREGEFLQLTELKLARVDAEFGFERKAAGARPESRENRYVSRWRRRESGLPVQVQDDGGTVAWILERPDLRELVTLHAGTNRATLDRAAGAAAGDLLMLPDSEEGRVLTLAGWWPVQVNGRVRSVTWTVTSGHGGLYPVTICSFASGVPSALGAAVARPQLERAHAVAARAAYYSVE